MEDIDLNTDIILPQKSHITIHDLDHKTFDAKIDTGNNSFCAIHADNIKINVEKTFVMFDIEGKTYTSPVVALSRVSSSMGNKQTRAVIEFDVHFADKHYEGIKFSLTDRSGKEYPILIGTEFLSQTNVLVKAISESHSKFEKHPSRPNMIIEFIKDPNVSDLRRLYRGIKKEYPDRPTLGTTISIRFFANDNTLYAWDAYSTMHNDALSMLKLSVGKFDVFGSVSIDGSGKIKRITTLKTRPGEGGFPEYYLLVRSVLKSFKTIQMRLGWEVDNETQKRISNMTTKAGGLHEYVSFGSTVRDTLLEGLAYKNGNIRAFDQIDQIADGQWYRSLHQDNMVLRWIYLPTANRSFFWNANDPLHKRMIESIRADKPELIDAEKFIHAGQVDRSKNADDKYAIYAYLDHTYRYVSGIIRGSYHKPVSSSTFKKIIKDMFLHTPKGILMKSNSEQSVITTMSYIDSIAKSETIKTDLLKGFKAI